MQNVVEMKNIMKKFAHVQAVDNGSFDLRPGEIHSLIGENGAGKSTMMKILYGLYPRDEGTILLNGKEIPMHYTPFDAIDHGIGMVHQEFMLAKEMTAFENIILGSEVRKNHFLIDKKKAREKINQYIETYNMSVQLDKRIQNISVGEAQRVEIIKALYRGAEILILDEPTAVLTPQEADKLFDLLEIMRKDNKCIIFISHRLQEVMQISDRITVMRGGKHVATVDKKDTSAPELAKMMVGREVLFNVKREAGKIGDVIFEVKDLVAPADRELSKLKGISFNVRAGEILGVAGVDGNGQSELADALTGLIPAEGGKILLDGVDITNKKPRQVREAGMTHIPEDRNVRGTNRAETIEQNLVSVEFCQHPYQKLTVLNKKNIHEMAVRRVKDFDVRPPRPEVDLSMLSGGNAQKVVVARELDIGGKLLVAAQPTRGVDIGAIESIRAFINQATAGGSGVLLISADLDEILTLSDRIIVLYEGKISGELVNDGNIDEMELGMLMAGGGAH